MSIGKRLIDLARSELNSLLEKAARVDEDQGDSHDPGGDLSTLSDAELAAETERRRQAREEVERATTGRRGSPPRSSPSPRRTAAGDDAIRKAYAALEIQAGSDFETVRHAYLRLMRKYHPDLHADTAERQRTATDLTQRLTESYKTLERHLRR